MLRFCPILLVDIGSVIRITFREYNETIYFCQGIVSFYAYFFNNSSRFPGQYKSIISSTCAEEALFMYWIASVRATSK